MELVADDLTLPFNVIETVDLEVNFIQKLLAVL